MTWAGGVALSPSRAERPGATLSPLPPSGRTPGCPAGVSPHRARGGSGGCGEQHPPGRPPRPGPPRPQSWEAALALTCSPCSGSPSLGLRAGARRLPHGVCDARQQVWSARARAPDLWVACEVRAPPRRCRDAAVLARLPVSGTAVGGGAGRAPRPRHRQLLPARRGAVWPSSGTAGPATTSQRALLRLQGTPPLCVQRPAEDARGRSDSTACLASPRRLGEAVA